jgi:hypothetical protein
MARRKIAKSRETMIFFTEVMRAERPATPSQLKAAELLGKHYGLFTGTEPTMEAPKIYYGRPEDWEE